MKNGWQRLHEKQYVNTFFNFFYLVFKLSALFWHLHFYYWKTWILRFLKFRLSQNCFCIFPNVSKKVCPTHSTMLLSVNFDFFIFYSFIVPTCKSVFNQKKVIVFTLNYTISSVKGLSHNTQPYFDSVQDRK